MENWVHPFLSSFCLAEIVFFFSFAQHWGLVVGLLDLSFSYWESPELNDGYSKWVDRWPVWTTYSYCQRYGHVLPGCIWRTCCCKHGEAIWFQLYKVHSVLPLIWHVFGFVLSDYRLNWFFWCSLQIFTLLRAFLFAYGGLCAAKVLHSRLLKSILSAPVSFFDVTPVWSELYLHVPFDCSSVSRVEFSSRVFYFLLFFLDLSEGFQD